MITRSCCDFITSPVRALLGRHSIALTSSAEQRTAWSLKGDTRLHFPPVPPPHPAWSWSILQAAV